MRQVRRSAAAHGRPQHIKPVSRISWREDGAGEVLRQRQPCSGRGLGKARARGGAGRDLQQQAWHWALAHRTSDGTLPSGREIARQYGRHERWGAWSSARVPRASSPLSPLGPACDWRNSLIETGRMMAALTGSEQSQGGNSRVREPCRFRPPVAMVPTSAYELLRRQVRHGAASGRQSRQRPRQQQLSRYHRRGATLHRRRRLLTRGIRMPRPLLVRRIFIRGATGSRGSPSRPRSSV